VTPSALAFHFDVHSPWCYLASRRIEAIAARHGRDVDWVPLHLARLMDRISGRRPLEANPSFVAWYRQDLNDWTTRAGVTLRQHPDYPLRPARALRACCFARSQGRAGPFARAVLAAYWTQAAQIDDASVLGALGATVGLEAGAVIAATADACWKEEVEANTEAAARSGIFGLPAMVADGKLFFGNDRLDLLDLFLAHGRIPGPDVTGG
jgi:2-hydroxychromene-2-carboxylate isomerase